MPFTVTQPLGRVPTFAELQALAGQHGVQIHGDARAGEFFHPGREQPKVNGNYRFESDGGLRGGFTGNVLGKLAGTFVFLLSWVAAIAAGSIARAQNAADERRSTT